MTGKKILEVIVNSLDDAMEAEQGGADRLEVVRNLAEGGLTPELELVRQIVAAVKIPVRVMLRQNSSMALKDTAELEILSRQAAEIGTLPVNGLVTGFILNGEVDLHTLRSLAAVVPHLKITFHRAFDSLPDPLGVIRKLKTIPQVDRILTTGGPGAWPARKLRLQYWQRQAAPEITILTGVGLLDTAISDLQRDVMLTEIHVGRAARVPRETSGKVSRLHVARLKGKGA